MSPSSRAAQNASRFARVRGCLAAFAVVGIAGTALMAPLVSTDSALADQAFQERIHQKFVPVDTEPLVIHLETAPAEELPPEPPVIESSVPENPRYTGGGSPAEWMAAAGIPESDWWYVDQIVSRESGWNPNATNPTSGACGLVQALPCSKVPGNGYDPVDNLRWAIGYAHTCVSYRMYCGWAGAYQFWEDNHWW